MNWNEFYVGQRVNKILTGTTNDPGINGVVTNIHSTLFVAVDFDDGTGDIVWADDKMHIAEYTPISISKGPDLPMTGGGGS